MIMTAGEVSDDQVMLQYNMLSVCEEADHTEMILSCSDMNDDFIYYKLQYLSKHALIQWRAAHQPITTVFSVY